jgi:hypothetical protein
MNAASTLSNEYWKVLHQFWKITSIYTELNDVPYSEYIDEAAIDFLRELYD